MNIEQILFAPEGKTLEFKENSSATKNIIKTLIAFSNTAGGSLIIGVKDDKSIIGIEDPLKEVERIASLIDDSIAPKIAPNIEIISYRNKSILLIQVYPGSNKPYQIKNSPQDMGVYYRVGSTNREADLAIIGELKRSVTNKYFDELPMIELNPEAIDFRVASGFFESRRHLLPKDLETLEVMLDYQGRKVPSIGGIILFSPEREKHFPDCWVQVGRFKGSTKADIVDTLEIHDYPINCIERAMDFVKKHALLSYNLEELQRSENWSIPLQAVREAIINAFAHCDYSQKGAPIRISIFENRLEIENPGILPFGVTIPEIMEGVSKIRNKVIVRVLHELGYIEKWGIGIARMIKSCQDAGLPPPEFKEIATRFRVTLFTKAITPPRIDETDRKIIEAIRESDGLSTAEISKIIGLSGRSIRTRLKNLVNLHYLYEVGTGPFDPNKRYKIQK
ncbi:MAG: helix-turn-helix domain-containing protein [Candidatus Paracaedibacteraceae bacterium]|nr:helix-turn-helix domain-containing protein [Candidatus Paracaedibacteraceae bacterium]